MIGRIDRMLVLIGVLIGCVDRVLLLRGCIDRMLVLIGVLIGWLGRLCR